MKFTGMAELYETIGKTKKCTFIFCADHGVANMAVSAYPQSTTANMVRNYLISQGGAANAFANFVRSELVIVDVGVDANLSDVPGLVNRKIARGTNNFTEGKAMTKTQARQSIKIGRELTEKAIKAGCNCFLIGEMGIANTTSAAAITAAILEKDPLKTTGRGSNISDARFRHKIKMVRRALKVNNPDPDDPIDVLSKVGGFEFGAMAGVILAAARHRCVVFLDGYNTTAAALIADAINPNVNDYLIASHLGREIGHLAALNYLGLTPMFTLDLALGEAIGSSIAASVLDSAVYTQVCDPEDDFYGDLNEEEDDDDDDNDEVDPELFAKLVEKIGIPDLIQLETHEDIEEYVEKNFGDDGPLEDYDLEFQLYNESRLKKYVPPFNVHDFNIPRSYPIMLRVMGSKEDEHVASTDRTFNFYLKTMPKLHLDAMEKCRARLDNLTKPKDSLGFLEDIAVQMAGITNEELPPNNLRRAALAFMDSRNSPNSSKNIYEPPQKGKRRNIAMDFSLTTRTFSIKPYLGVTNEKHSPTVAFNFGRNLAEEISFSVPIIALTVLSEWQLDKLDRKFGDKLLNKKDNSLKVPPEEFLSHVPKEYRNLTSALMGAIVAAAHNGTLVVIDCGVTEIIARYLEKICPEIRPFLLYATKLINCIFLPGFRIGSDGEVSCIGVEIVEAALTALNEMKTFSEAQVDVAINGDGAKVQTNSAPN